MVLRVKIEIVPFGDEDKTREIHRFDIFNKGDIGRGSCAYGVIDLDLENNTGGLFIEDVHHLRSAGALELVETVLEKRALLHKIAQIATS